MNYYLGLRWREKKGRLHTYITCISTRHIWYHAQTSWPTYGVQYDTWSAAWKPGGVETSRESPMIIDENNKTVHVSLKPLALDPGACHGWIQNWAVTNLTITLVEVIQQIELCATAEDLEENRVLSYHNVALYEIERLVNERKGIYSVEMKTFYQTWIYQNDSLNFFKSASQIV